MIGFEEGLARRKTLDGASVCLEHLADSVAYMAVVIDNKDDLPGIVRRFSGAKGLWEMRCGSRRREEALDGLCQLFKPHRLVESDTVMTRNIEQRACRYVTGQDDDGDLTMKLRTQLRGNLEPIQSVRHTVVRKDEIRPDLSSRN